MKYDGAPLPIINKSRHVYHSLCRVWKLECEKTLQTITDRDRHISTCLFWILIGEFDLKIIIY
jgi:hypothetical protein